MLVSFLIIIIIILFYCIAVYSNKNKCININKQLFSKRKVIQTLIRQACRWSVASVQDTSPLIAVLHANYGAGYLWALRDIATDQEILQVTGVNIDKFKEEIIRIQDLATKKALKVCPNFFGQIEGIDSCFTQYAIN